MTSNNNTNNISPQIQQLATQQMQNINPTQQYKNDSNNNHNNNGEPSDLDNTNLYIKGLWKDCTQIELDDLFKQFGVITQSRVYGDGVGFVRFEQGFEAKAAIDTMHNAKLDRCQDVLLVKYAFKKQRNSSRYVREVEMIMNKNTNNVYLRCLPPTLTEPQLKELCEQYGELTCTRLRESGVAFVRYRKSEDAQLAIRALNGKRFDGHNETLLAKLANSDPFQPKIGFKQSYDSINDQQDNISIAESTNTMTPSQGPSDIKLPPQPYIQYNNQPHAYMQPQQQQQQYTYVGPQQHYERYYTPNNVIVSTPGPQPQPYPHNYTHPNAYNNIYYQYPSYPQQVQYQYPSQPQPQQQYTYVPPQVQQPQQPQQYVSSASTQQQKLVTAPKYMPKKVIKPSVYIPQTYYPTGIGSPPASELSFRGVNTHGSEKSSIAHAVDGIITEMGPVPPKIANANGQISPGWQGGNIQKHSWTSANIGSNTSEVSIEKAMQNLKIIQEPNKENMVRESSNPHGVVRVVANQLHEVISSWYPTQAGKLTGMFLQNHDQEKVEKYLGRKDKLKKKIDTFAKLLSTQLTK